MAVTESPYPLFETDDFYIFYKPPGWKMDTDTNYDLTDKRRMRELFDKPKKNPYTFISDSISKKFTDSSPVTPPTTLLKDLIWKLPEEFLSVKQIPWKLGQNLETSSMTKPKLLKSI